MKKIILVMSLASVLLVCCNNPKPIENKVEVKSEILSALSDSTNNKYGIIKLPNITANLGCDSVEFQIIMRLLDINNTVNYETQLAILRNADRFVCNDNYYKCIIDYHIFGESNGEAEFSDFASAHAENTTSINYYKISANSLSAFINKSDFANCYQYHVKFQLSNGVAMPSKERFAASASETYYSIPLLRGIILKLKETNPDVSQINFEFCNAKINGSNKVIFKVKDINSITSYYNYSQDPKMYPFFVF